MCSVATKVNENRKPKTIEQEQDELKQKEATESDPNAGPKATKRTTTEQKPNPNDRIVKEEKTE